MADRGTQLGYDLRSALRAQSGLSGGPAAILRRLIRDPGARGSIESGERRWEEVEFGAVAKKPMLRRLSNCFSRR
jgi:hypothetical protein